MFILTKAFLMHSCVPSDLDCLGSLRWPDFFVFSPVAVGIVENAWK